MRRIRNNQNGFGVIELILIVVIVGVVGFIGWTAYSNYSNTKTTTDSEDDKSAVEVTTNTCLDSKTKVTFAYPKDWSTKGTTQDNTCGIKADDGPMDGAYVMLISPKVESSPYLIRVQYGGEISDHVYSGDPGQKIEAVTPLRGNLSMVTYSVDGKVMEAVLTTNTYEKGQTVAVKTGKAPTLTASLTKSAGQQYIEPTTIDTLYNHPQYNKVLALFESVSLPDDKTQY